MLKTNPRFQSILCALGEEWKVTPNLQAGLEEFTCAMCGRRQFKDVNNGYIHFNNDMDLISLPSCRPKKGGKAAETTPSYSLIVYSITEAPPILHDHKA